MKKFVLASLVSLNLATAAAAATLNESDVNGGFGSSALTPTQIALDTELLGINGSLGAGASDFLRIANLTPGARTVTLTFGLLSPNPNAAGSGGGTVTVSPLGQLSQQSFNITKGGGRNGTLSGVTTLSFNLDNSFAGGNLDFGLTQSSGNRIVTYAISVPGNIPAPIPIPPAGALLLFACAGLLIWRRKRGVFLHRPRAQAT